MTRFRSHLLTAIAVLTLALVAFFGNEGSSASVQTPDADKVLEIQRYPNEPLELVRVRIGAKNVKDHIKTKYRDNKSKFAIDSVKFKEKDDWYKRISITLSNASDKSVYGVQGFIFFKPAGFSMMFSTQLTASKELRRQPLEPGAELELTVTPTMLNYALEDMKLRGADVSNAVVSFSLDTVIFSDELRWYRGRLVRPDSFTPGQWVPVDQPLAGRRTQPAANASFVRASFKPAASMESAEPQQLPRCKDYNDSHLTQSCAGGPVTCVKRTDLDSLLEEGVFSMHDVSGLCIPEGSGSCTNSTTHRRMEIDPSCECITIFNEPEQGNWQAGGGTDCSLCQDGADNDCDGTIDQADSGCSNCPSPVVVDVSGNGFNLTNTANGVNFDLDNNGTRERLSWTAPQSDDAWLALDRNGDGMITNGGELFGNFTPQFNPPVGGRNGFNALGEYDQPAKGGNGDGFITNADAIFATLILWQDKNHNGVSEANELSGLTQLGLKSIECDYGESKRRDQFGNAFRYRAKVTDTRNTRVSRWAWDVFLLRERNPVAKYIPEPINWSSTDTALAALRK